MMYRICLLLIFKVVGTLREPQLMVYGSFQFIKRRVEN